MGRQFDELSKDLARGVSRRRALWRFGASVVGVMAARFVPEHSAQAALGDSLDRTFRGFVINGACSINGRVIDFSNASSGQQIVGTEGDDCIIGSEFNDQIDGLGGDDEIFGRGGNDQIRAGRGNDQIRGEGGNDQIVGGRGNDLMDGGTGTDVCAGDQGSDFAANCEQTRDVP